MKKFIAAMLFTVAATAFTGCSNGCCFDWCNPCCEKKCEQPCNKCESDCGCRSCHSCGH